MKRFVRFSLGLIFVLSQLALSLPASIGWAAEPAPDNAEAFVQAAQQAVQEREAENLALLLQDWRIDLTEYSKDGEWAIAWLGLYDPQTGELIPTEPGLVIGRWEGERWQVAQPQDAGWLDWLAQVPDDLLTPEQKQGWVDVLQRYEQEAQSAAAIGGYYLPWEAGIARTLGRSVAHDDDYVTAHYAFDFYTSGVMWNIYAAKTGTVWMWRNTVPNGDDSGIGNYIIIKDDNNNTYQQYLHLAQYSIPPELLEVGAPVMRGQFIGVADDTGQSTGHHLHFQVHQNPDSYWGQSIDITFEDVDIYGGRPRREWEYDEEVCGGLCVNGRRLYVSGNVLSGDRIPPHGEISGVANGDVITTTTLLLSGWAADDDSGLRRGQVVANFNGAWNPIGAEFTSAFTHTWDLCDPANLIPDGAVSVALRLEDWESNITTVAGIQHFIKDAACAVPPTACVPGTAQVALFEGANYTGGCALYAVGNYSTPSPLADNQIESVLVGEDVVATLYSEASFSGHAESFLAADPYLVGSLIGANMLTSLRVALRTNLPQPPTPLTLQTGEFGQGDLIPLSWVNGGGAVAYQVQVSDAVTNVVVTDWMTQTFTYIEDLPMGEYFWRVRGRGPAGEGPWSGVLIFTVGDPQAWGAPVGLPFNDDMESSQASWTATGFWTLKDNSGLAHGGTRAWWYADGSNYDNGQPNMGFLTSRPISITGASQYLRFWYRYQTESRERVWDQRWVQIAVNGGPFENVYQFGDDPLYTEFSNYNTWLQSPAFSLAAYNGQTIRVRLAFLTMDGSRNAYGGWAIDDLTITNTAPASCSDNRQDDTPAQAFPLTYSTDFASPAEICPGGDYDYYQFVGVAGERVVIDINARSEGGTVIDTYVVLYDSNGTAMLAENDDEVYASLRDSLLAYTLPHDGVYYIQVRDWKHPYAGGSAYDYRLRVYTDADDPQAIFHLPPGDEFLPDAPLLVSVDVTDLPADAVTVEFYWHGSNWQTAAWTLSSTDRDGTNGWSYTYSIADQPDGWGSAVYVRVYDQAGNTVESAVWNLGIDHTAPTLLHWSR